MFLLNSLENFHLSESPPITSSAFESNNISDANVNRPQSNVTLKARYSEPPKTPKTWFN